MRKVAERMKRICKHFNIAFDFNNTATKVGPSGENWVTNDCIYNSVLKVGNNILEYQPILESSRNIRKFISKGSNQMRS